MVFSHVDLFIRHTRARKQPTRQAPILAFRFSGVRLLGTLAYSELCYAKKVWNVSWSAQERSRITEQLQQRYAVDLQRSLAMNCFQTGLPRSLDDMLHPPFYLTKNPLLDFRFLFDRLRWMRIKYWFSLAVVTTVKYYNFLCFDAHSGFKVSKASHFFLAHVGVLVNRSHTRLSGRKEGKLPWSSVIRKIVLPVPHNDVKEFH